MSIKWAAPLVVLLAASLLVTNSSLIARAQAPQAPQATIATAFTYQGQLKEGTSPANGAYDMQFTLFNAPTAGTQVGPTVTLAGASAVQVTNGIFTATLDFGSVFDGSSRYLEIGVRPTGVGSYTTLSPRQALTPAPYSITSLNALSVPWTGVTGKPDLQPKYARTIVVSPYGNGANLTANGQALLNALASITDAGAILGYLVKIEPGTYDITGRPLQMLEYVDIEGSGEGVTTIRGGGMGPAAGTVIGASHAELRYVTVENPGGQADVVAIYNSGASPRLTHVTARALNRQSNGYGVYNQSSMSQMSYVTAEAWGVGQGASVGVYNLSSPTTMTHVRSKGGGSSFQNVAILNHDSTSELTDVTAEAWGSGYNCAIYFARASPTLTRIRASAWGGDVYALNYGVFGQDSSAIMTDVRATASGSPAENYAVRFAGSSSPVIANLTAEASGGNISAGFHLQDASSPTITGSAVKGGGGATNYGVYSISANSVTIDSSKIIGSTSALTGPSGFTARVGGSKLDGGPANSPGTLTCVASYNGDYKPLNELCQ